MLKYYIVDKMSPFMFILVPSLQKKQKTREVLVFIVTTKLNALI